MVSYLLNSLFALFIRRSHLYQLFDTVSLPIHDTALVHVLQGLGNVGLKSMSSRNCEMISDTFCAKAAKDKANAAPALKKVRIMLQCFDIHQMH